MHKAKTLICAVVHSVHMLKPLLFELWEEIYVLSKEEGYKTVNEFFDKKILMKLAYVCDFFNKLNVLNTSLPRKNMLLLNLIKKKLTLIKKLKLWRRKINESMCKDFFFIFQQFLTFNGVEISQGIKSIFEDHL